MTEHEMTMSDDGNLLDLIIRVLSVYNDDFDDGIDRNYMFWRTDGEYAPITLIANCSDLFWWGVSDAEEITADNVSVLEQALADVKAASAGVDRPKITLAGDLFCCRVRGMRPQKPVYKTIPDYLKPLFDACGPERDV